MRVMSKDNNTIRIAFSIEQWHEIVNAVGVSCSEGFTDGKLWEEVQEVDPID